MAGRLQLISTEKGTIQHQPRPPGTPPEKRPRTTATSALRRSPPPPPPPRRPPLPVTPAAISSTRKPHAMRREPTYRPHTASDALRAHVAPTAPYRSRCCATPTRSTPRQRTPSPHPAPLAIRTGLNADVTLASIGVERSSVVMFESQ
ncbi:hypothetical protein B0H14DRAFT_3511337 [Mycena olivaceomarginata]|nr:hypothetical protein B0H14DRAFT_3511337 [Mycena olivaceomarginata]